MRHVQHSLFVFMLLVLFIVGTFGFANLENKPVTESFYMTVAALTFSSDISELSPQGKMLNTALALATVAVIVWAFVNFHMHSHDISRQATNYFKFLPKDEGLVLKEVKAGSGLAGLKKIEILQRTGTVVLAVKKGNTFEINVPFDAKITAKSSLLLMGTPSQLKATEKKRK